MHEHVQAVHYFYLMISVKREVVYHAKDSMVETGVRKVTMEVTEAERIDIPHIIRYQDGTAMLITIPARLPICLRCYDIGHKSFDCKDAPHRPRSYAGVAVRPKWAVDRVEEDNETSDQTVRKEMVQQIVDDGDVPEGGDKHVPVSDVPVSTVPDSEVPVTVTDDDKREAVARAVTKDPGIPSTDEVEKMFNDTQSMLVSPDYGSQELFSGTVDTVPKTGSVSTAEALGVIPPTGTVVQALVHEYEWMDSQGERRKRGLDEEEETHVPCKRLPPLLPLSRAVSDSSIAITNRFSPLDRLVDNG